MKAPALLQLLTLSWACLLPAASASWNAHQRCSSLSISDAALPHVKIASVTATPIHNFSIAVPQNGAGPYNDTQYSGLDFCNVTITYIYLSSQDDFIVHTTVWLPLSGWNGRFQGTGGSGFATGLGELGLAPAVAEGYAAAETDGGHSNFDLGPQRWALDGRGHVDLEHLTAFASTSLNDLTVLGKAVIESFYGVPPKYSYWNGCSTGGRQGLMLAQRYPNAFDGIAALSPAINWPSLTVSTFWPQQVMNRLGHYPRQCELAYVTKRAVEACDDQDGLRDGILSLPGLCTFNASETVGDTLDCDGVSRTISEETAAIANAAWSGNGVWYGLNHDAYLGGMANTTCTNDSDGSCSGVPFAIAPWIPYFVERDPDFPLDNMTDAEYFAVFKESVLQYQFIIGTADSDLSAFKAGGGKMISTHGLADPVIFPNGTVQYYKSVMFFDPNVQDFYRFFEAPGIGHCGSPETYSFYPQNTLEKLVRWVEEGEVPETIEAVSQRGDGTTRPLCPYPLEQQYLGGDVGDGGSFRCVQSAV